MSSTIQNKTGVLLVSCYELGHQPHGLASPLGFLERSGVQATATDVSVEPLDEERVRSAWFIGVSVPMHTALRLGMRVVQNVRQWNPDCHICFYGLYATLNADYLLSHGVDSVIGGEHEGALTDWIAKLDSERTAPSASAPERVPPRAVLTRLDFPVPSRRRLQPLQRYAHVDRHGELGLVGYTEASRGCLHHCRHCPIPPVYGGRFFVVPKATVLADVAQLVEAGASHISFGDPDFLNGPGHSLAISREMHTRFPWLTFDFTAKIEHLLRHRRILAELRSLGCIFVVTAAESLSDTVLVELDKGHSREDIFQAVSLLREAGIAPRPTWVAFTPWTTRFDYLELLEWIEREGLIQHVDPVQYGVRLLVPPGSLLLERSGIQPFLGPLNPEAFTYSWTHPDRRMDELHREIGGILERATRENEEPERTFRHVVAQARAVVGRAVARGRSPASSTADLRDGGADRPPRLTEPWFC